MKGRFIRKIAAAFAAVLVTAATAAGQSKVTVSGYMTDAASGESLISATLLDRISGQGAVTNNYGFYTLTLPAGEFYPVKVEVLKGTVQVANVRFE